MGRRLSELEPVTANLCVQLLQEAARDGIKLVLVQGLRTWEEQEALYQKGRSRPGSIVTHAPAGHSWHNYGRAFDVAFAGKLPHTVVWEGPWDYVGKLGRNLGMEWGGDWPAPQTDCPHFEYTGGLTIDAAMANYLAGDRFGGTTA
jgi:peptidoglycan L-alanyl-D-glutamate endopeptidase CwlK